MFVCKMSLSFLTVTRLKIVYSMTQNTDITKACFMFRISYGFMAHV